MSNGIAQRCCVNICGNTLRRRPRITGDLHSTLSQTTSMRTEAIIESGQNMLRALNRGPSRCSHRDVSKASRCAGVWRFARNQSPSPSRDRKMTNYPKPRLRRNKRSKTTNRNGRVHLDQRPTQESTSHCRLSQPAFDVWLPCPYPSRPCQD